MTREQVTLLDSLSAPLAREWDGAAAGAKQTARIEMAEATRKRARRPRPSYGALPDSPEILRHQWRAEAAEVRAFVLSFAAMLVMGERFELLHTMAGGVALVCSHSVVEGERCRCAVAVQVAEECEAEARRRGILPPVEPARRVASVPANADGVA